MTTPLLAILLLLLSSISAGQSTNPFFKPFCPPSKYPIYGCPPATLPSMTPGDYDWDWDYQPGNRQWVCRGIQTGRYAELSKCAGDAKDDDRWPLKLRVKNISNHTRGNKFYSSFTFRHSDGTVYKLDVKPNLDGYTLNRYGDTTFTAIDRLTGQNVELTVKASAWR